MGPRFLSGGPEARGPSRFHTDASSAWILDEFSHQARAAEA